MGKPAGYPFSSGAHACRPSGRDGLGLLTYRPSTSASTVQGRPSGRDDLGLLTCRRSIKSIPVASGCHKVHHKTQKVHWIGGVEGVLLLVGYEEQ